MTGVLGARACACNERVRLRVRSCVCLSVCARACARVYVCLCERVCAFSCDSIGWRLRARVCSECVRAPRRCARPPIARRRLVVLIARPAPRVAAARAVAFGASGRLSRAFGRRCHVDEPHGQRAMGCTISAHVRGRRRRRHLRHRRRWRHLLPGRVGEHRRRCAGRTRSRGGSGGTRVGYLGGTQGY